VENILDMSKIDSGYLHLNLKLCDIADLVGMAVNEIQSEGNTRKINVNITEYLPTVMVDVHWFKQALINILHNAIQYTPADSEITMEAYCDSNELVVLEISDNGPGVPEESIGKLFEKFYRVPGSKSGGIGLGLTIVKAIIDAHNGIIFAENKESKGLSVTIKIASQPNE
jgi:two-component system sensor histidine kinase KdpD